MDEDDGELTDAEKDHLLIHELLITCVFTYIVIQTKNSHITLFIS